MMACEMGLNCNCWLERPEALRSDAGVMFGESSPSSSDSDSSELGWRTGVLGRLFEGARPFPETEEGFSLVGFLMMRFAVGLVTVRLKVTVVCRVTLTEAVLVRITPARPRLGPLPFRLRARLSRDAICCSCSRASLSTCSRAASI